MQLTTVTREAINQIVCKRHLNVSRRREGKEHGLDILTEDPGVLSGSFSVLKYYVVARETESTNEQKER